MKPYNHFHGLDHLRALAILLVFFSHYSMLSNGAPAWLPDFVSFFWTGVDLFFVLSGFLIASHLFAEIKARQTFSYRNFFIKRSFRILPAYAATLALYFLVPFFREKKTIAPVWKFATFTQNFGLDLREARSFSHAWSLCVEEHFYLFLPLIVLGLLALKWMKKGWWLLVIFFLAGFACRYLSYEKLYLPYEEADYSWVYWYKFIYYPTYNRLDGLLVGVSIAAIYIFLPATWMKWSRYGNLFLLLGLGLLTGAYFLCEDQSSFYASIFGYPIIAIGFGLLVMGAISSTTFLYKYKSGLTKTIALLSYGTYLTHKAVIHMTRDLLSDVDINPNILFIISMITSFLFAYVLYLLVERPFMHWRRKVLST